MKRKQKDGESAEMVSLNQQLFSLEAGNLSVEELDRRLELALAAHPAVCGNFSCGDFGCSTFMCSTFKLYD